MFDVSACLDCDIVSVYRAETSQMRVQIWARLGNKWDKHATFKVPVFSIFEVSEPKSMICDGPISLDSSSKHTQITGLTTYVIMTSSEGAWSRSGLSDWL